MPRAEEDGRIVHACGDRRQPCTEADEGDDACEPLLKSSQDKEPPNLHSAPVPIKLAFWVNTKPVEVGYAERLDALGPFRRRSPAQDLMAFSMTARRLSISAILSA